MSDEYTEEFKVKVRRLMKVLDCTYIGKGRIPNLQQFRRARYSCEYYKKMVEDRE